MIVNFSQKNIFNFFSTRPLVVICSVILPIQLFFIFGSLISFLSFFLSFFFFFLQTLLRLASHALLQRYYCRISIQAFFIVLKFDFLFDNNFFVPLYVIGLLDTRFLIILPPNLFFTKRIFFAYSNGL